MTNLTRPILVVLFITLFCTFAGGCHMNNIKDKPSEELAIGGPCWNVWQDIMDYYSTHCAEWQKIRKGDKLPPFLDIIIRNKEDTLAMNQLAIQIKDESYHRFCGSMSGTECQDDIIKTIAQDLKHSIDEAMIGKNNRFTHLGVIEVFKKGVLVTREQLPFRGRMLMCCFKPLGPDATEEQKEFRRRQLPRDFDGCTNMPSYFSSNKEDKLIYEELPGSNIVAISKYEHSKLTGDAWWRFVFFPTSADCLKGSELEKHLRE